MTYTLTIKCLKAFCPKEDRITTMQYSIDDPSCIGKAMNALACKYDDCALTLTNDFTKRVVAQARYGKYTYLNGLAYDLATMEANNGR